MNKIIENLNWRYATKEFNPTKKVSAEDLETIVEAFRLTASSFGLQPWKLFIIENQDTRNKLLEHSYYQKQVVDASHVLVFARSTANSETLVQEFVEDTAESRGVEIASLEDYKQMMLGFLGRMDETQYKIWAEKQLYIALWNLLTVLAEMEIDSCAMEGLNPAKYDETLWLTEKGFATVFALPIGYRSLKDKYADIKKVRYSTDKIFEMIG